MPSGCNRSHKQHTGHRPHPATTWRGGPKAEVWAAHQHRPSGHVWSLVRVEPCHRNRRGLLAAAPPVGGGARCLPPPPTAGPSYQLISSSSRRQVLRDPLLLPDGRAWRWERRPWRQNCLGSNPCDPSGGSSPSPGALWCVASRCHSQCLGQEVTRPGVGVAGGQGQKFRGHDNNLSGVTDLWAPLSHAGRGRVVLGHTLNTL